MSPVTLLFWASLTSVFVLTPIAYAEDKTEFRKQFSKENFPKNLFYGLLNPFLYYYVLFKAYDLLPTQIAQPLNYTWPIVISLFSVIFLKEKFNAKIFAGILVSFAGIVIVSAKGNFDLKIEQPLGVVLALGSAVVWAIFWTMKIKDKRKDSTKLFASFFYGTAIIFFYILIFDKFVVPELKFLLGAIYVGLFEMGITFFLWMKGLSLSSNKSKTSTLAFLSPFVSLFFIATVLGEKIEISSIIGLALIISGIALQNIKTAGEKSLN